MANEFVGPPAPAVKAPTAPTGVNPIAAYAAGTALKIFGQIRANADQANAEIENAIWLDEQAKFAEESSHREEMIFQDQVNDFAGQQIGTFAANNVELSGSAVDLINNTFDKAQSEVEAIREQGRMNVTEAKLKAGAARQKADRLKDPMNNFLQAAGTALTGASKFA